MVILCPDKTDGSFNQAPGQLKFCDDDVEVDPLAETQLRLDLMIPRDRLDRLTDD